MRRFTGACFVACAGTAAISACDLGLEPFVPDAGGTLPSNDSGDGIDVNKPVEDSGGTQEDTGAPDVVIDAGDAGPKKRVFITSTTGTGAFGATGAAALTAADTRCQSVANAANMNGTFVAWISFTNPAVPAITHIAKDVGPWYLVNGPIVFANKAAIAATGPAVAIDRDETGKVVGAPDTVWTGTQANGAADNNLCATVNGSWTSAQAGVTGQVGQSKEKNQQWTQAQNVSCLTPHHLYCFEQ